MLCWVRCAVLCYAVLRCAVLREGCAPGGGRQLPGLVPPMLLTPSLICPSHSLCCLACRAHGVSPSYPVLLDAAGSYSEGMLRGLDYLLAEAGSRGLKVCCSSSEADRCVQAWHRAQHW